MKIEKNRRARFPLYCWLVLSRILIATLTLILPLSLQGQQLFDELWSVSQPLHKTIYA